VLLGVQLFVDDLARDVHRQLHDVVAERDPRFVPLERDLIARAGQRLLRFLPSQIAKFGPDALAFATAA